jgi:hypothetical protein
MTGMAPNPQPLGFTLEVDKRITITVEFINSGKTPARHFRQTFGFGIHYDTQKSWSDSLDARLQRAQDDGAIGAGQPRQVLFEQNTKLLDPTSERIVFSVQDSFGVLTNKAKLFAMGKISYMDTFGEQHFTEFCFVYRTDLKTFIIYPAYNNGD